MYMVISEQRRQGDNADAHTDLQQLSLYLGFWVWYVALFCISLCVHGVGRRAAAYYSRSRCILLD